MKKIYCEIHMFNLDQNIYIVDTETKETECVTVATLNELPEIICALCDSKKISNVILSGNSMYSAAVSEDILAYSTQYYSQNEIEIEVVKK